MAVGNLQAACELARTGGMAGDLFLFVVAHGVWEFRIDRSHEIALALDRLKRGNS